MKNNEIARIFFEIADILEIEKIEWKPQAYIKAANSLENLGKDVEDIYKEEGIKGLEEIPGVGEGLAKKIIEFIETGKINEYEKLKNKIPKGVHEIMHVPGIGMKKAMLFCKKLGIKNIKQLEKAAKEHKIRDLPSFKEKSEENIIKNLEFFKKSGKEERRLLGIVLPIARNIENELKKLDEVKRIDVAGSIRRMKETIRDVDILIVTSDAGKTMDYFTKMKNVARVLAKGKSKASVLTEEGLQVDLRVIKNESYGSALHYFTGSKEHNIHLRKIALKKGLKFNEYGVFKFQRKKEIKIAGRTEEDVYKILGLRYLAPELREDSGEIEVAEKNKLPKLVNYNEIKGDLHIHTTYSDGNNSIEEMAKAAEKFGYEYIAISDHAGNMKIANSMNEKRIEKQIKEIDKLNERLKLNVRILKGAEVDILSDGKLSIFNNILRKLDVVMASIHLGFKFDEEKMTSRVLKAMDNPYMGILGHPTGRLIFKREPYAINLDRVYEKAKENNIALEINAFPDRLDLNDTNVRDAVSRGVKLAIGTDSHSKEHLKFIELGIGTARRGWAESKDVLNTSNLKELEKWMKR